VASVTMNGAMRARPISTPLSRPMPPQTASGRAIAGTVPHWAAYAVRTPASAKTEPTERSMPPLMMTNVIPIAIRTRYELSRATFRAFCGPAKLLPNAPVPTSSTRTSTSGAPARRVNAASPSGVTGRRRSLVVSVVMRRPDPAGRRRPRR
jgi:hypothetical protein